MSETSPSPAPAIGAPPLCDQPAREPGADPHRTLQRLASELRRAQNRKLLIEFLHLRRTLR